MNQPLPSVVLFFPAKKHPPSEMGFMSFHRHSFILMKPYKWPQSTLTYINHVNHYYPISYKATNILIKPQKNGDFPFYILLRNITVSLLWRPKRKQLRSRGQRNRRRDKTIPKKKQHPRTAWAIWVCLKIG